MKIGTMNRGTLPVQTVVEGIVSDLGRALSAMAAGARAARDYRHLTARTDAALAREGLARDGIVRAVLERNFR